MDGSMRQVLIDEELFWPNGIALDFEYMRLYWADAKLDKIERSNLDGSDRTVIVDSQLPHIFGFDVAGNFWSVGATISLQAAFVLLFLLIVICFVLCMAGWAYYASVKVGNCVCHFSNLSILVMVGSVYKRCTNTILNRCCPVYCFTIACIYCITIAYIYCITIALYVIT